jgi:hypothetical protein
VKKYRWLRGVGAQSAAVRSNPTLIWRSALRDRDDSCLLTTYAAAVNSRSVATICSEGYGFGKKATAFRQVVFPNVDKPRGREDFDRRPSVPNKPGELQAIHWAGHLDVGKDDSDAKRVSGVIIASSALVASTTSNPASSIIPAAFIRIKKSSSTKRYDGTVHACTVHSAVLHSTPVKRSSNLPFRPLENTCWRASF